MIFDRSGRLLILKPNYKKGWTIPGGQIEESGESPWEACRRETFEECGLEVSSGRLACVDFLPMRVDRPGGLRFVFDCGSLSGGRLSGIRIDPGEIDEHRFLDVAAAAQLLSGPVRRRVLVSAGAGHCVYLENGRPVDAVRG
jgi:8-oxo-dGTP diphosphatase